MNDWSIFAAAGALLVSLYTVFSRTTEKSLSIREYEAFIRAAQRETERLEVRLRQIEQTRPTTGELQILATAFNKRLDEIRSFVAKQSD